MDRDISIVIATRNRAHGLQRCLAALAAMDPAPVRELLIADNGSTDDTAAVIAHAAATMAFPVHRLDEPSPGACRARNRAIAAATGGIIAFTDDDCYPAPDWARRIADAFAADPGLGYLGGRIILFDEDDARFTVNYSEIPHVLPPRGFVPPGVIQGANMAFRRDLLLRIGLFDEAIGAGTPIAAEDCDLVTRASLAGAAGSYLPGPLVRHHHGRKPADIARLQAYYDLGRGYFYAKTLSHPGSRVMTLRNWLFITRSEFGKAPGATLARVVRESRGVLHYCFRRRPRRGRPEQTVPVSS
jgi:GT2 family glycosyltransferase